MRYLLDTNVWILSMDSLDHLPQRITKIITNPENLPLGLSAISPWEVFKKESLGRLQFTRPVRDWVFEATRPEFIQIIPLTPEVSHESCHLPQPFHKDPADQIIVATARVQDLILITKDGLILDYPHTRTLWE